MSDWFTIRRQARRDIHAAFAVAATYVDSTIVEPVDLYVRWHDRLTNAVGDIGGGDYARAFENIDKLVFSIDELAEKSLTLRRGGSVVFPDYDNILFVLDILEPADGPFKAVWTVARHNNTYVAADTGQVVRIKGYMIFVDTDGNLMIRAPDGTLIPLVNQG